MNLSNDVRVTKLAPNKYSLETQHFGWEPSIGEMQDAASLLSNQFESIEKEINVNIQSNVTAFVRHESVCIGFVFRCTNHEKLEKVINQKIFERE